jgi:Family of unknown function (DUF6498)
MAGFNWIGEALRRPGAAWVVAANAIPVAGVLLFGWQALPLLVFYWIENVVIGAVNVAKILIAGVTKDVVQRILAFVLAPFFILHYGLFCFVHGIFVFAMFTMSDTIHAGVEPTTESFDLTGRVLGMLQGDSDLLWSVVALCVIQLGAFAIFWVGGRRWRDVDAVRQMFEPYGRIVVLHLTIFIATIPVLLIGQPMLAVLVLALLKSGLELGLKPFQVAVPDLPSAQR